METLRTKHYLHLLLSLAWGNLEPNEVDKERNEIARIAFG